MISDFMAFLDGSFENGRVQVYLDSHDEERDLRSSLF